MAAAAILGIGRRSVIRYTQGDQDVPPVVEQLIEMMLRHGVPKDFA